MANGKLKDMKTIELTPRTIETIILTLLALVLLTSCHNDVLELEQYGYLKVTADITIPSITAKANVPECSPFEPNKIRYRLLNSVDQAFLAESTITLNGNIVTVNDEMRFPIGNYEIDEISLIKDNVVTHTVPHELDLNLDLTDLVSKSLPYTVTISPDQTTSIQAELLCYTIDPIELSPNWEGDGTITDLVTLYFYVPENPYYNPDGGTNQPPFDYRQYCIDYITITQDGDRTIELPIYEPGLNQIPIKKEWTVDALLSAYQIVDDNAVLLQGIYFDEYNADGILDESDIMILDHHCD